MLKVTVFYRGGVCFCDVLPTNQAQAIALAAAAEGKTVSVEAVA